MQRVVKPRNKKSQRALEDREPKAIENTKSALFIRGVKCSEPVLKLMKDFYALKKPYGEFYSKKNEIRPFEDANPLEIFAKKSDASLFAFGNHNKKRPNNLILGRMYDYHLLDMIELGVDNLKCLSDFKNEKIPSGTKPVLLFSGPAFETDPELSRCKSLLIDFFRGPQVDNVRLNGLEHALQFTLGDDENKKCIHLRSYKVLLKKSGSKLPRVELEEIGPSVDLVLRRTHLSSDALQKEAMKTVKNVYKPKKVKNVEKDGLDNTLGRIHVPAQKIGKIQTRKMKGLKGDKKGKKKDKPKGVRQKNVAKVFGSTDQSAEPMEQD